MKPHLLRKLHRSRTKIIVTCVVLLLVYNEYLSYVMQSWPRMECQTANCIKILLVSDPQILGEHFTSRRFPIDALERWDSDRFLAKTFRLALRHLDPDVVVFLGDLMDEGSIATSDQFQRYLHRFNRIFRLDEKTQAIFLPGDNDIGGEDNDPIIPDIVERFQDAFQQYDVVRIGNFNFFKVNRLTYMIPRPVSLLTNTTHIILSHLPLLFLPMPFVKKAVDTIQPKLIFSGHHHKSIRITADVETGEEKLVKAMLPEEGPLWRFKVTDLTLHEVMVPTCSYRMGVDDVGFGAAVIDTDNGFMWYAVLWLPRRLNQLMTYVAAIAILTAFLLVLGLTKLAALTCRRR